MVMRAGAARVRATLRIRNFGAAPTSAAGVAYVVALAYAGTRVATVLQMIPALPTGLSVSPRPHAYLALWLAGAAVAIGVATVSTLLRRPLHAAAAVFDVALAAVFLVLSTAVVPTFERVGSWVGWAPGYALTVVLALGRLRIMAWLTAVGVVAGAYLYFVSDAATAANRTTIASDTLSLLVFGAIARLVVRYVTRVAADADEARAQVAELARREEEHRAQLTMHDAATIMQLLTEPALPSETREQLCEQAITEVRRMRAYLRGGPGDPSRAASSTIPGSVGLEGIDGGIASRGPAHAGAAAEAEEGRVLLREVVQTGMVGFADLGLEPALDLLDGVTVTRAAGEAVRGAVAGTLHNVRRHARASMVVVHGDAEPDSGRWIVTIRDDGVGFDPAGVRLGTGLRRQVLAELRRHDLVARIASTPGLGTRITIEGESQG